MSDKQLLKLLKHTQQAPGDPGRTAKEIAVALFGVDTKATREKVWERLGREVSAGRAVAGRGMRQNMAGVWHGEPVYRLVEA